MFDWGYLCSILRQPTQVCQYSQINKSHNAKKGKDDIPQFSGLTLTDPAPHTAEATATWLFFHYPESASHECTSSPILVSLIELQQNYMQKGIVDSNDLKGV